MIKLPTKSGFTLIELIITIGLLSVVTTVLVVLFMASYKTYSLSNASGSLQVASRGTLDRMTREIRQAVSVVASNDTYVTGDDEIVLQMASIDNDETIIPATYDFVVYRLDPTDPTVLQEVMIADAASARRSDTRNILNNVDSLNFTYFDATNSALSGDFTTTKRVTIEVNSSQTQHGQTVPVSYSEQATVRNK